MVYKETLNTRLMKESLKEAMGALPFLAGRLSFNQDGRLDINCNNAGARLVVASTSTTLTQLRAGLTHGAYSRGIQYPVPHFAPPQDFKAMIREQWPLLSALLVHLSGGGTALWLCAHHAVADFESLQTIAAAWSAAYSRALGCRAGAAAAGAAAAPGPPAAPATAAGGAAPAARAAVRGQGSCAGVPGNEPLGGAQGSQVPAAAAMSAAAVEAYALGGALPAAGLQQQRSEFAVRCWWSGAAVAWLVRYHMMWRGGGVEARTLRVPTARLAALKAQAMAELAREREAAATQHTGQAGLGGAQTTGPGAGAAGEHAAGVDWVSTNDALIARLLQVLHALPCRSRTPLTAFVSANMRRRLQPPLPAGQLGNILYSVLLQRLRPSGMSLGSVAAELRRGITTRLVPQFRDCLARAASLVRQAGPAAVTFHMLLARDHTENVFAPEGPANVTNWDVKYDMWQFGQSRPLAFRPLLAVGPGVLIIYPAAPEEGAGGVLVEATLHGVAWRQLDALYADVAKAL